MEVRILPLKVVAILLVVDHLNNKIKEFFLLIFVVLMLN